jgi:DNA invertase Pin-like site-specific DNA recombinase
MDLLELKAARETYQYVPARLIRAPNDREPDLNWKSLKLVMDIPKGWDSGNQDIRSQYSSIELDEFHYALLKSESEYDLIHGLLSIVFWGFASGTNGRINSKRALRRAEAIIVGRKNALLQPDADIVAHIKKCRQLLNASQIAEALREATQIKFLQMAFASKLLTFMAPNLSTSKQDTENQRRELEASAARSGWLVVRIYEDAGISGAKGRDKRPGLDAMLKAVNRKEFDMVAAWSVDRLGRSLTDLLSILQGLHDKGVDLFLHQQGLDTSTTAGRAMFQMLGVFAEFERGIIRERVNSGLARAKAKGTKLGRPAISLELERKAQRALRKGTGILKVAKLVGLGTGTVHRIKREMEAG